MEASFVLSSSSSLSLNCSSSSSSSFSYSFVSFSKPQFVLNSNPCSAFWRRHRFFVFLPQNRPFPMLRASEVLQNPTPTPTDSLPYSASSLPSSAPRASLPKVDKSGRFCSPRAARELALLTIYAACLEGSDPVRLFEKRLNIRREPGYEFDNALLTKYNHMSFGGPPVKADTVEEADELMRNDDRESAIEAEVLSAPPKLVYSKLILSFTRKLLVAVVDRWNSHVLDIDKIAPSNWKNEPTGRILEFCILHLAMSEITVLGTRHQIVINEAVDIAKRFCDGAAPRIINGCLRTFVKGLEENGIIQGLESKKTLRAINL